MLKDMSPGDSVEDVSNFQYESHESYVLSNLTMAPFVLKLAPFFGAMGK